MATIKAIIPEARHMQMGQKTLLLVYHRYEGELASNFWEFQAVPPPGRSSA